jgi:hypothetical protein
VRSDRAAGRARSGIAGRMGDRMLARIVRPGLSHLNLDTGGQMLG